jgi:mono/diheme cytochrome c family protein
MSSRASKTPKNLAVSVLLTGFAITMLTWASGQAASEQGWYTGDQAQHGHILFNNYCAECHRPDLTGAMGPALIGPAFLGQWEHHPLDDLYTFEHTNMPAVNPGSVPDEQMWAITAYILQRNGFPGGQTPLGADAKGRTLEP